DYYCYSTDISGDQRVF
nr:immunoglobulin light chain junction region [Macaca mulatta]MOX71788.1 immunoglobulin light chain junction region [Macaca mulatta]MOX71881.1 immunoglobulin light chain junction region [Macaca mulatta]MOX72021.1 immunoglobulin light chain junction region [Macaca mulatta]MOX72164.1 immunoglobulin light chain junction region [Macaca mulatta]